MGAEQEKIIPGAKEFEAHDSGIRERLQRYKNDHQLSIGQLAGRIGLDRSILSKYLNSRLRNERTVEAALKSFLTKQERTAAGDKYVRTTVSEAVVEACEYALQQRKLIVLYGPAQIGKSTGAQEFMRRKLAAGIDNLVFVTANATTTPHSLVRRICNELGIAIGGCIPELLERILAKLKRDPHLIVVDDASHLNVKALESLRYLHDQAACGVVLMGVKSLMERVFSASGRMAEDLEQLYSRVDLQKYLPGAASRKELAAIARAHGIDERTFALIAARVRLPREMLKVCDRVKYLRRLNPEAESEAILSLALSEIFRAA